MLDNKTCSKSALTNEKVFIKKTYLVKQRTLEYFRNIM